MIYGVFLLFFMRETTLNWICFKGINIFVLFLWICSGESSAVFFSPTATNIGANLVSSANFFEAIDFEDW